jgi:sugar/nucleoside kinase (ribokinase family)
MANFLVVGDSVVDIFIEIRSPKKFKLYDGNGSISDALSLSRSNNDNLGTDQVWRDLGGPALTTSQYLRSNGDVRPHDVSVVTVLGRDDNSGRQREVLEEKLGARVFAGQVNGVLPRCAQIFVSGTNKVKTIYEDPRDLAGNVFDDLSPKSFEGLELASFDYLLLPTTRPQAALKFAREYRKARPDGVIVYAPGQYLTDPNTSFSQVRFKEVLRTRATDLVLNREEEAAVLHNMELDTIKELFNPYSNLHRILRTRDIEGLDLVERDGSRSTLGVEQVLVPRNPVGAGDAVLGMFYKMLGLNNGSTTALLQARTAAEAALFEISALNYGIITNGTFVPRGMTITEASVSEGGLLAV